MTGAEMIAAERLRQQTVEGYDGKHDDRYIWGQLINAAACYLDASDGGPQPNRWPWRKEFWKPRSRVENLVRAGALIAAQIDLELRRAEQVIADSCDEPDSI